MSSIDYSVIPGSWIRWSLLCSSLSKFNLTEETLKEEYYCGDCIGTPSCLLSSMYKELCEESDGEECTGILENKAQSLELIECAVRDLKIYTSKLMSSMSDSLKSDYQYIENVVFNCEVAEKLLQSYRTEKKIIDCWDILRSDKRTQMTFYGFECDDEENYFLSWLTRKEVRIDDTMIYTIPLTTVIPKGMGIVYYVFFQLLADEGENSWFPSGDIDWANYSIPQSYDWISAFRDTDSASFYPKIEDVEISEDDRRLYEDFIGRRAFTDVTCNENLAKYISDKDYINSKRLDIKLSYIKDNKLQTIPALLRLINEETIFIKRNQIILKNQFYSDDKIDWATDYYKRDKEYCKTADKKFLKYYQTRKPENLMEELSEYLVRNRRYNLNEGDAIGQSLVEEYITKCIALNNEASKIIIDKINIEKQLHELSALSSSYCDGLSCLKKAPTDNKTKGAEEEHQLSDKRSALVKLVNSGEDGIICDDDGTVKENKIKLLYKQLYLTEVIKPLKGWEAHLADKKHLINNIPEDKRDSQKKIEILCSDHDYSYLSAKLTEKGDFNWSDIDYIFRFHRDTPYLSGGEIRGKETNYCKQDRSYIGTLIYKHTKY